MLARTKLIIAAVVASGVGFSALALAQDAINGPKFNDDGSVVRPIDWETWVFVGSPLTPNALNGGKAPFQEFHSVYIEPSAFKHFKETGKFANGTQLVKVRTHLYEGDACFDRSEENGSCQAVSGRGYFNGEYSGFELTVKDTNRFEDPGGWVYYNFGENPKQWADSAKPFPAASCNACHESAAANDFVFTQFYPVLRDSEPKVSDSRAKAGE
ncbi:MAG: cytochrome P460 family protein [Ahrensia sp.]|nr:cytochrome P460 family protein [Ahrensia sp.]